MHHRSASHSRWLAILPLPTGTLRLAPREGGVEAIGVPHLKISKKKIENLVYMCGVPDCP